MILIEKLTINSLLIGNKNLMINVNLHSTTFCFYYCLIVTHYCCIMIHVLFYLKYCILVTLITTSTLTHLQ